MFSKILKRMWDMIHGNEYVMTPHARKEMNDDELSIYDIESVILTGEIVERQKDRETTEWKYRVVGEAIDGVKVETVIKISPTDKLVIITVYAL